MSGPTAKAKAEGCYWGTGCSVKGRQCSNCVGHDAGFAEASASSKEMRKQYIRLSAKLEQVRRILRSAKSSS